MLTRHAFVGLFLTVSASGVLANDAPIPFGMVAPTSGSVALDGRELVEGGKFAVEEFNKAGGLNGRKVNLFVEDGECRPAVSTAAADKLIARDKVIAMAGALCSSATRAIQPISEKNSVPLINGVSSDPTLTDPVRPWFFRTKIHNNIRGRLFAKFIADDLKLKKLMAIAVDDDFGRSAVASFTPVLKKLGSEFVGIRYFKHGEVNFMSMLNAARSAGADGLFLVGEIQDGSLLMKQYHQLKLTMPVVALGSFNTPGFFKVAGNSAEGVYTAEVWGSGVKNSEAEKFVADWRARHNTEPGLFAVSGYVEIKTLLEAMKAAGKADSTAIRDALKTISWNSPIGQIKFDDNHQAHTLMFVTKNSKDQGLVYKTFESWRE